MIAQIVFLVSIYLVGLICIWLTRCHLDIHTLSFLALPTGISLWVIAVAFLVMVPLPLNLLTIFVTISAFLAFLVFLIHHFYPQQIIMPNSSDIFLAGGWFFIFVILSVFTVYFNYIHFTTDSLVYEGAGRFLALSQQLDPDSSFTEHLVSVRLIFIPAIHTAGPLFGFEYTYAIYPMMAIWVLGLFAGFCWRVFKLYEIDRRVSIGLVLLATLTLASMRSYIYHGLYVHSNLLAAILFFIALMALFFYRIEAKRFWLPISSVSLAMFAMARPEGIAFALIPLGLFVWGIRPQRRADLLLYFGLYLLIAFSWHINSLRIIGIGSSRFLDGRTILLGLAATLGLFSVAYLRPRFRKINFKLANPVLTAFVLTLLIIAYIKPDTAITCLKVFIVNMFAAHVWGVTWFVFGSLLVILTHLSKFRERGFFNMAIVAFVFFLLLIGFTKHPPRVGQGDSLNRMMFHIIPIVLFLITLHLGNLSKKYEITT